MRGGEGGEGGGGEGGVRVKVRGGEGRVRVGAGVIFK